MGNFMGKRWFGDCRGYRMRHLKKLYFENINSKFSLNSNEIFIIKYMIKN